MTARPHKAIGMRDLSRRTKDVIEEVSSTGVGYLVLRFSEPIARIVPIDDKPLEVRPTRSDQNDPGAVSAEEIIDLHLTDDGRVVLEAMEQMISADRIKSATGLEFSAISRQLAHLEVARVCKRTAGGYRRTLLGDRVVLAMRTNDGEAAFIEGKKEPSRSAHAGGWGSR